MRAPPEAPLVLWGSLTLQKVPDSAPALLSGPGIVEGLLAAVRLEACAPSRKPLLVESSNLLGLDLRALLGGSPPLSHLFSGVPHDDQRLGGPRHPGRLPTHQSLVDFHHPSGRLRFLMASAADPLGLGDTSGLVTYRWALNRADLRPIPQKAVGLSTAPATNPVGLRSPLGSPFADGLSVARACELQHPSSSPLMSGVSRAPPGWTVKDGPQGPRHSPGTSPPRPTPLVGAVKSSALWSDFTSPGRALACLGLLWAFDVLGTLVGLPLLLVPCLGCCRGLGCLGTLVRLHLSWPCLG